MNLTAFFVEAIQEELRKHKPNQDVSVRYAWIFDDRIRDITAVVSLSYTHVLQTDDIDAPQGSQDDRPHWFVYQLTPYWEQEAEMNSALAMELEAETKMRVALASVLDQAQLPESQIRVLSRREETQLNEQSQSLQPVQSTLGRRLTSGECTSSLGFRMQKLQ